MCIATISEMIIAFVGMANGIIPWSFKVFLVLECLYLVTVIATYNKADSFFRTVIAKDLKDNYSMSELALQFKTAIPSEGIARVNNRHIQTL